MRSMIEQFAGFTRGGFELARSHSDLRVVGTAVVEELRVSSRRQIVLAFDGDLQGEWDPDRLAEVTHNIATNAVEHAVPGTPVVVLAYDEGDYVVCSVTNRGPDIPPELLPVIFEPFRHSPIGPRNTGEHLGLGLYFDCEIVKAHGGLLSVSSAKGVTRFKMRLPRA